MYRKSFALALLGDQAREKTRTKYLKIISIKAQA